ncbi:hypothetical protein LINPERHAP2_LOCUS20052 [Linum perenne]
MAAVGSTERTIFADSMDLAPTIAHRISSWVRMIKEVSDRSKTNLHTEATRELINVAWDPGPEEWITLNTDGSFAAILGRAAAGGLARDSEGRCKFAYTMNLSSCFITRAEIRGAVEGMRRAWEVGFRKVAL